MLLKRYLFFSSTVLLLIYLSAGIIINSNLQYFLLFLAMTALAFVFLRKPLDELVSILSDLAPLVLYFVYFLMAAIWALYPFQAIYFTVNDLVYLMAAVLFVFITRYRSFTDILKLFRVITYSSIFVTVYLFIRNPQLNNVGGNSASMLYILLPYLFIYESKNIFKKYLPILICLLILLLSVSRTPLLAGMVGILLTFVFTEKTVGKIFMRFAKFMVLVASAILMVIIIPFTRQLAILFFFKITSIDLGYTGRVLEAAEDEVRVSLTNAVANIYPSYWFQGMGYMNFMQWYGESFGVYDSSGPGKEIVGVNLHSTYETWALEGGLLCLVIVCFIVFTYIKRSHKKIRLAQTEYERKFHIVGLISLVPLAIFGAFHQLHQSIIFYMLIGIVFARHLKQGQPGMPEMPLQ